MLGGTFLDASQVSSDDHETSEQTPSGDGCNLQSSRDSVGYSRRTRTSAKRCEAPWRLNGLKVRNAKHMAYDADASFRKYSVHHAPHKIVSSWAISITRWKWGWVFFKRTRISSGIHFTRHFIEFVLSDVKMRRRVGYRCVHNFGTCNKKATAGWQLPIENVFGRTKRRLDFGGDEKGVIRT